MKLALKEAGLNPSNFNSEKEFLEAVYKTGLIKESDFEPVEIN